MIKKLIPLIFVVVISCNNEQRKVESKQLKTDSIVKETEKITENDPQKNDVTYYYMNNDIDASFTQTNNLTVLSFKILFKNSSEELSGEANLMLIEDELGGGYLPEGSPVLDEKRGEEYLCDSTYYNYADNFKMTISFEKENKNRIALVIYDSKLVGVPDGIWTLYKKE